MKVAFLHDWLVTYRGGEKVLETLLELYPDAPVYTLFYSPEHMPEAITRRQIIYPRWLAPLKRLRKALLPILPTILEALPLEDYDLIISSSSCVAKGAMVGPHAKHICYIHSPMRYVWDQREHYLSGMNRIVRAAIHILSHPLRLWDVVSASRVDLFIANSRFVSARVARYYGRSAKVLHPPIALDAFKRPSSRGADKATSYFLVAGAFVAYKRFDLAIQAAESLGVKLIVAGAGPEEQRLRRIAGTQTTFVISPDDEHFARLLREARALLFPGLEDFGMIAIEAMISGTPVLAYQAGGALDFIVPGVSGAFFPEQSVASLRSAMETFQLGTYEEAALIRHGEQFSRPAFLAAMRQHIAGLVEARPT